MKTRRAFTLIEVMIATGIFFMAMFAILTLVSTNLRNARKLQESQVDAGPLIAELSLTNKLSEGEDSGDFGDLYPGYEWTREITEVGTNGLFQVDFSVYNRSAQPPVETHTSVLLFRPDSTSGRP